MEPNAELIGALARARAKFTAITKDGKNPHLSNRYATIGSVLDAVSGPLLEEGIVPSQTPVPIDGGKWALQTTLLHSGGGSISGLVPLEYGEARGLNPMQVLGSAISYARRYGLLSILCLTAEDDDGATAGHAPARHQGTGNGGPRALGDPQNRNQRSRADSRREESPEVLRDRQTAALAQLRDKAPPSTGKALFRLVLDLDPARNLLKAVNEFGAQQGWGPKLVEWSAPHVLEAVAFVREEMELSAAADRELN